MRLINKSLFFIVLFISVLYVAQGGGGTGAPPTPVPGDDGTGGGGTGAPSALIDMYLYILSFAALFIIALYAKKFQKKVV